MHGRDRLDLEIPVFRTSDLTHGIAVAIRSPFSYDVSYSSRPPF